MGMRGSMPEVIFLAPIGHTKDKIRYKQIMLVIDRVDEVGFPCEFHVADKDASYAKDRLVPAYIPLRSTRSKT